jgi:hypothetical protein
VGDDCHIAVRLLHQPHEEILNPQGDVPARFAIIGPPVVVIFRERWVVMNGGERRFQSRERARAKEITRSVFEPTNSLCVRAAFARDRTIASVD